MHVLSARLESSNIIRADFSEPPTAITVKDVLLAPAAEVHSVRVDGLTLIVKVSALQPHRSYSLLVRGSGMTMVDPDPWLQLQTPQGPLGCVVEDGVNVFRLFAPRASAVRLQLYDAVGDTAGDSWEMEQRRDGVWEIAIPRDQREVLYTYSVDGPRGEGEAFNPRIPVADPYAHAVVSQNTYRHESKAIIPSALPPYDWQDDKHVSIGVEDLIIYEMHVKDMTAHPSSGADSGLAGTYAGLTAESAKGGLNHLRSLGVNAVELLPCQHYAWIEPPYLRHTGPDLYNHWNPWERNHWGYMTSYYFAPEPRYAVGATTEAGMWNDVQARHVNEFRDMVRRLHGAGIAVIMDVVFNHTSQYDYQPLRYIDKKYYYRLDGRGEFLSHSGCGNDFYTDRPAVRKLIVDCIRHWIEEYHIDGFRFDLAAMIDDETLEAVREEAKRLFPDVILIAEPWGGGRYDLTGFSEKGYASWNDVFRNGVKGHDPMHHTGYIFGHWGGSTSEDFGKWVLGSVNGKNGPFLSHAHCVNYLEAHDGYTLGDFVRIATGSARPGQQIDDLEAYMRLGERALAVSKLAALILLTSRGAVMLHAGQEFGRGKLIADKGIPDVVPRVIDHNSYEKDDETNWLDYRYAEVNSALLSYYRGLIEIRNALPELRHTDVGRYRFLVPDAHIAGGYIIGDEQGRPVLAVLVNANHEHSAWYDLGTMQSWQILADAEQASAKPHGTLNAQHVALPPCSGMILRAESVEQGA